MLPLLGAAPTPHSNIGDISGKYERILTTFSEICLLIWVMSFRYKNVEICYPLLGQPHPLFYNT